MGIGLKIVVIGWGSLIWDARDLEIDLPWREGGPMLPVEFARFSSRDRLTLVLVDGAPEQPTRWAVSKKASLEEAAANLQAREGCLDPRGIASWPRLPGRSGVRRFDAVIRNWVEANSLDGAVWTALGAKGPNGEREVVPDAIRLEYLRALEREGRAGEAREYIEKAPPQIRTPFRELVRQELGWG